MNTLRVFFAIIPPKKVQAQLLNHLQFLKHTMPSNFIRWIDAEKMHVTLQFLGSMPQEQLTSLIETVRTALKDISAFPLELGHLEWFPTARHPKILSLSAHPHDLLTALSDTIGNALITLNYPVESRPFRGHLSMARLIKHDKLYDLAQINLPIVSPFVIRKIYLIESRFVTGGQSYVPLAEFQLV